MSAFPNFSNIAPWVTNQINSRRGDEYTISNLNAWVRVASGVGDGLTMISNASYALFSATGGASIYGDSTRSGTVGETWAGGAISAGIGDYGYRPKPNITSIEIDEGAGSLSRKATFTITAYTLGQLNTLSEYFLEPGYTIFLEWGWNDPNAFIGFQQTLDVDYVANNQSFTNVNNRREATSGLYDNYLGFITGGSIGMSGDTWTITVKCTGFTELPAYLMAADNSEKIEDANKDSALEYTTADIASETDLGKKRFMMAFNRLPSNRRTSRVASFITDTSVANEVNFINVDETVKAKINDTTAGTSFFGLFSLNDEEKQVEEKGKDGNVKSESVEFPQGTKIIGDEAFIRFGTLMQIINQIGIEGYYIGGKLVTVTINTKDSVCCAFEKIYSTSKAKLYIPNENTPLFSLITAAQGGTQTSFDSVQSAMISDKANTTTIRFPMKVGISNGVVSGEGRHANQTVFYKAGSDDGLDVDAEKYGFVDDLYVNMDFAKGILETKNFSAKDALYQILNGMASAAGGMWDFQIIENTSTDGSTTELKVVDFNLVSKNKTREITTFDLTGVKSIFMEASLDLDISGAKMNQIIGKRLGQSMNGSQPSTKNDSGTGLFTTKADKVLTKIKEREKPPEPTGDTPKAAAAEDSDKAAKEAKQKAFQLFLSKIGYYPFPSLDDKSTFEDPLNKIAMCAAFNDQVVFDNLKVGKDKIDDADTNTVSALMPIKFHFKIHGVSGIKRGDKFKVRGIPQQYENNGFFQVLSVKHVVDGMLWTTDVEGGFRRQK